MRDGGVRSNRRRGTSAVEVAVVVFCVVILLVLLVPWIYSTRDEARAVQSIDRLRQLARGVSDFGRVNDGRLPSLVDGDDRSWPVQIVSHIGGTPQAVREAADRITDRDWLPTFVAPNDPRSNQRGALSYAANGGFGRFEYDAENHLIREVGIHTAAIDLDDDGEVTPRELLVNYATGVIWRPGPEDDEFHMTRAFIETGDGLRETLLLAENFDAGSWRSTATTELAVVIGRQCLTFEGGPAGPMPLDLTATDLGPFAVGAIPDAIEGHAPRPISLPGAPVHFAFCDGSARPISPGIDPAVYARLMTSNGTAFGEDAPPAW